MKNAETHLKKLLVAWNDKTGWNLCPSMYKMPTDKSTQKTTNLAIYAVTNGVSDGNTLYPKYEL